MKLPDKQMISVLHKDTLASVSALGSFRKDLLYEKGRLEEIAAKNSGREIHERIEQFQNKFIIQEYELARLLHDLKVNEQQLAYEAKSSGLEASYELSLEHSALMERVKIAERMFRELKQEFARFLAERL